MEDDALPRGALPKVAAWSAVATTVSIAVHITYFILRPPPYGTPASEWFALFRADVFTGLISLDALLVLDYVLLVPIVLALYVTLRRRGEAILLVGLTLFFVAIAAFVASNPALEVRDLAQRHAEAATPAEAESYLAAAEAALARSRGTAFHTSYLLGSIAGILLSIPMLRDPAFGRVVALFGITGNVVGLGLYIPRIGLGLGAFSGVVLWFWYVGVARGLFRAAKEQEAGAVQRLRRVAP